MRSHAPFSAGKIICGLVYKINVVIEWDLYSSNSGDNILNCETRIRSIPKISKQTNFFLRFVDISELPRYCFIFVERLLPKMSILICHFSNFFSFFILFHRSRANQMLSEYFSLVGS